MRAMILEKIGEPLRLADIEKPVPNSHQFLIKVLACGICRTDLHVVDGELSDPKLPLVPGHQIVGLVDDTSDIVGVPWLGNTCGRCEYCLADKENLCDDAKYTGYSFNGGFAEYCVADKNYCFKIPDIYSPIEAAPLLCAGLIGYRAYRKIRHANTIGIYGFGAAAHILVQLANFEGKKVYAFTRDGDTVAQDFAISLGAKWAGPSNQIPPKLLDAAIIFAPVGELLPLALSATKKGATVVCAGIHMSQIPAMDYQLLWGEREVCSVANLTRRDGIEFLKLAREIPIKTEVTEYTLEQTNTALDKLRSGDLQGAAVINLTKK